MAGNATLERITLPDFGIPTQEPKLSSETYRNRLDGFHERVEANGYDMFVIYADREHFANMQYLTGFDPRFEEALLVLNVGNWEDNNPRLVVGVENLSYADISPVRDVFDVKYFQGFSLPGIIDRDPEKPTLTEILGSTGIDEGTMVGVAGWQPFESNETDNPATTIEIPAYIVDVLRDLSGDYENVQNGNDILMDSSTGLRIQNELDQLAYFEFCTCHTSQALRNVIFRIEPGMTEFEVVEKMNINGMPLSAHIMLSSGDQASLPLSSPSKQTIENGDPLSMAYGLRGGALNARAGYVVEDREELPNKVSDYVDKLVSPYFEAIAAWYEHIGIGVTGGELYDIIDDRIGDPFYGIELNPGHFTHLDEFVNTSIYKGSTEQLQSHMVIAVDVIPKADTPYFTTNLEDRIALADENLRKQFADTYPEAWKRIQRRREFMEETLHIELKPEILPFSNIPAYLPPYLLSPNRAMVLE